MKSVYALSSACINMHITIVGAGPVGLLLSCLLSRTHIITVLDKRTHSTRSHPLNISDNTIMEVLRYLATDSRPEIISLREMLNSWRNFPVSTIEIETSLSQIATNFGVIIRRGVDLTSLNECSDSVIIGADGAKSRIRSIVFNDELTDRHNAEYMVQLKYQTPGATRPRLPISAASYSYINGLSGSDMVLDFESLASPNDSYRKPGTLHIPVSRAIYDVLSAQGRGTYSSPWTLEELAAIPNYRIGKLGRIINRYHFSLKWRGGWLEDALITVIPLDIYRSAEVVKILPNNTLVMLCGDSASGLVYQRGLSKGWLEAVKCAQTLSYTDADTLSLALAQYSQYCIALYESERDAILAKHHKITSINTSVSITSTVVTAGLGLLAAYMLSRKLNS